MGIQLQLDGYKIYLGLRTSVDSVHEICDPYFLFAGDIKLACRDLCNTLFGISICIQPLKPKGNVNSGMGNTEELALVVVLHGFHIKVEHLYYNFGTDEGLSGYACQFSIIIGVVTSDQCTFAIAVSPFLMWWVATVSAGIYVVKSVDILISKTACIFWIVRFLTEHTLTTSYQLHTIVFAITKRYPPAWPVEVESAQHED